MLYPDYRLATSESEAVEAAESIGYPVVLKIVSPDIPHKSEAGGVVTGLATATAVRQSYSLIVQRANEFNSRTRIDGVLVCKEMPQGVDVIVGATRDPIFGPTVMFGMGGIFTEIMKDVSFRVAPLIEADIKGMIQEIKGYPLLSGARGQSTCDLDALSKLLQTVTSVIIDHPDILELDLNPVRLYQEGLSVLDIRIMVNA